MLDSKRAEFARLFREFAHSYPFSTEGMDHIERYEAQRRQGCENFKAIASAASDEDVADQVLLKLLPYNDFPAFRQKGAWIHVAPTPGDPAARIKSKWPDDWPQAAQTILNFIRRCNEHPDELREACEEFSRSPYSSGLQTGTLTPILNALRPDYFLLVNNKPLRTINYFAGESYGSALLDYPDVNEAGYKLIEELAHEMAGEMRQAGAPELRDADKFDMFSHWLVAIKQYRFPNTRYWKLASFAHVGRQRGPSVPLLQAPAALQLLYQPPRRPLHDPQIALPELRIGLVAHAAQSAVKPPI